MRQEPDRVDWVRCIPFIVLHAGCFGVIWVGASAAPSAPVSVIQ